MWEVILLVWPLVIALAAGVWLWKCYPIADDCVIKTPGRTSMTFQSLPVCKSSLIHPPTCRAGCGLGCSHAAMQPCSRAVCKWLRGEMLPVFTLTCSEAAALALVLAWAGWQVSLSLPPLHSWPWPPLQPSSSSFLCPCQPILSCDPAQGSGPALPFLLRSHGSRSHAG